VTVEELIRTHPHPTSADRQVLLRCIDDCFDCADACGTAGRIVTRQTEPDVGVIRATIEASAAACRACREECERHADRHDHCRICAATCSRCEQACDDLLAIIE
jgi:hypothetical protein